MPLVAELEKIQQEIEVINADATEMCTGLDENRLAWRPQPGRWSIAENLLHLRTTTRIFLPATDQAIADARRRGLTSSGPFRLGPMGRFYVWYVEPPPVIRLPAPKQLRPVLEGPARDALPLFLESQNWMLERVQSASGIDLSRARVIYPLARYIRMDLLAFFSVFTGHGRRHIWQARKVLRQLDSQ